MASRLLRIFSLFILIRIILSDIPLMTANFIHASRLIMRSSNEPNDMVFVVSVVYNEADYEEQRGQHLW